MLTITIGPKTLSYNRAPVIDMKRNVVEAIYDATFGGEDASNLSLLQLEGARVEVTDFGGNKMKASVQQVWEAVLKFFVEGGETPWCINDGKMVITKPGKNRVGADGKRTRQVRQGADAAMKVRYMSTVRDSSLARDRDRSNAGCYESAPLHVRTRRP